MWGAQSTYRIEQMGAGQEKGDSSFHLLSCTTDELEDEGEGESTSDT